MKTPKSQAKNHNDNQKEKAQPIKSITRGDEFEFGHAVAHVAILQICENIGFKSFQTSALSTLADIASLYLRQLGKHAHFYANLAGRTESTALDVIHAMEDLNEPQGFAGASDVVSRRISASQTVRNLVDYVRRAKEVPFARPVSRFPVASERSSVCVATNPAQAHIPPWLPAFPNPSADLNPNTTIRVSLFEAFAPSKQEFDREPEEAAAVFRGVKRKSEILAAERAPVRFRIESGKKAASIASVKNRADKILKAIQN